MSATCFNTMYIPLYDNEALMTQKLSMATANCEGYGLIWATPIAQLQEPHSKGCWIVLEVWLHFDGVVIEVRSPVYWFYRCITVLQRIYVLAIALLGTFWCVNNVHLTPGSAIYIEAWIGPTCNHLTLNPTVRTSVCDRFMRRYFHLEGYM